MLRSILCICTALVATAAAAAVQAGEVKWHRDIRQAVTEASRAKKPLLIEFSADWCGYCRRMQHTTFADEGVIRHVNGCFVPVAVDADENGALVQAVGVEGLPTTVIISPELKVVKRITGYQSPEQMREHLGALCHHEPTGSPDAVLNGDDRVASAAPPRRLAPPGFEPAPRPLVEIAFQRVCLVSLRDEHVLRAGDPSLTAIWRGRTVCFASPEYVRRFEKDPEAYWPVLDGRCAVSAAEDDAARAGDARLALVYRKRVWLFTDRERQQRFFREPAAYGHVAEIATAAQP